MVEYENFCFRAAKLTHEQQAELLDKIRPLVTAEQLQALQIGIAYIRLLMYPELKQAMKTAICAELMNTFKGDN